jgi:ubiquinone/menaquinone biosynthesis C-methylase UbiE
MTDVKREIPERDRKFIGTIPELYHRHLGPMFMEPYARDLAQRVAAITNANSRVLEIAAGTGIVTRALRAALPPSVEIVATDLNQPMLDIARSHLADAPNIRWQIADATSLQFPDASFDAVVCQFGVMFFPDKERAMREVSRVLRPGGSLIFSTWGPYDEDPIQGVADRAISDYFDGSPPDFYSTPFGFHDSRMLRELAESGGFAHVTVEDVHKTAEAESAYFAAVGLVEGNPIVISILERGGDPKAVTQHVADALSREIGDKPIRAPMVARVVTARKD